MPKTIKSKSQSNLNNEELWQKYFHGRANGNGQVYKNQLTEMYSSIVEKIAEKAYKKLPRFRELDDLKNAGTLRLIRAIEKFNPKKNVQFKTYAKKGIKGGIINCLQNDNLVHIPLYIRKDFNKLQKASLKLESILGYRPTNEQLAEEMDVSIKELEKIKNNAQNIKKNFSLFSYEFLFDYEVTGLEKEISCNERENEEYKDLLINCLENSKTQNPAYKAQKNNLKNILTNIIKSLPKRERQIIRLYYYKNMTYEQIGEIVNLSTTSISKIRLSVLNKLKCSLEKRMLSFDSLS